MSLPSQINTEDHRISLENPNGQFIQHIPQSQHRSQINSNYLGTRLSDRSISMPNTRSLRDNLQNVFQEIRPLVQTVQTNWLSSPRNESTVSNNNTYDAMNEASHSLNESFVINLDQGSSHANHAHSHIHSHSPFLETANEEPSSVSNGDGTVSRGIDAGQQENIRNLEIPVNEALRQNPEARAILTTLLRYLPFSLILLAKALYDNREILLILLILLVTFIHGNKIVIREAGKQQRKSFTALFVEIVYVIGCIILISYLFKGENIYMYLVFMGSYVKILTVWDLLWTIGIVDITLKLITIGMKVLVVLLPGAVLSYQKRGKIFLMIEMCSQLYRALAPIQPWLYYLLDYYHGSEKIMGVLFSAAYMVSKGTDLLQRTKSFKSAVFKMLQDVNLGISPTMEQLMSAGNQCPICHDEYSTPVLLACKHIFCEPCVTIWFDREQTCPLCRAKVVEDPSFKNGATTFMIQLY